MISTDEIKKRIAETKYDIFPLNRMLPLTTVYRFFIDEYHKHFDKSILMKDRKYQRLREAYFSLFVGVVLSKEGKKEYFIRFPEDADNDIDFISKKVFLAKKQEFWRLVCDVKEFTSYSGSFREFVEKSIAPKIKAGAYHIIIGLHKDIRNGMLELLEKISSKESTIWVISNPSQEDEDFNKGIVVTIQGPGFIRQDEIDLSKDIPLGVDPPIIYQDVLRNKLI